MRNTHKHILAISVIALVTFALTLSSARIQAQQKDLGEVNILTAVSNMAFSAVWVAEQLKYFEQEGVRAKITPGRRWRALSKRRRRPLGTSLRFELRRIGAGANRRRAVDRDPGA